MIPDAPLRLPDSKPAIREALARLGFHPHKRFGQHFLGDPGVLDRIVAASGVAPGAVVLEVGPGLGCLTERLLRRGATVVAVEIDHGLAGALRSELAGEDLVVIERDVMQAKGRIASEVAAAVSAAIARRGASGFSVVSNLPYGISTSFVASLMHEPGPPERATLMLQSEVASALLARASTEAYSALSVFARIFFSVRREFDVGRHAFFPVPDVDSTVVTLVPRPQASVDPSPFSRFVQRLFQGRRKAIATTLRAILPEACGPAAPWLATAGFDPKARVDALEPDRIAALFAEVARTRAAPSGADDILPA